MRGQQAIEVILGIAPVGLALRGVFYTVVVPGEGSGPSVSRGGSCSRPFPCHRN
jgi:hypothetical protein